MVSAERISYNGCSEERPLVHLWTMMAQNLRAIIEKSEFETKAQWAEAAGVSPERLSQYLAGDPRDYRLLERLEEMVSRAGGNPAELLSTSAETLSATDREFLALVRSLPAPMRDVVGDHIRALAAAIGPELSDTDREALQLKRDLGDRRFFQAVRTAQRMMEIVQEEQAQDAKRSTG